MARRYDSRTTIFSPEGRLYQVEYAMEAISHAGTCLGILASDGILIAAEKRNVHKLLDDSVLAEKIYRLSDNIACTVAGITADANILINHLRFWAADYKLGYGEDIPVEQLVRNLCNEKQRYTQVGGKRPFGVSLLYMGWDKHYGFQLYQSDPSGNYTGWKATCIGNNHQSAVSLLKQEYKNPTLAEAKQLAMKVLWKTLDVKLAPEKIEMAVLVRKDGKSVVEELSHAEMAFFRKVGGTLKGYCINVYNDYRTVTIDALKEAKNKPLKTTIILSGLGGLTYLYQMNPTELEFKNELVEKRHLMTLTPSPIHSPQADNALIDRTRLLNQNRLHYYNLWLFSLIIKGPHDDKVRAYSSQDKNLRLWYPNELLQNIYDVVMGGLSKDELNFQRLLDRTKKLSRKELASNIWKITSGCTYLDQLLERLQKESSLDKDVLIQYGREVHQLKLLVEAEQQKRTEDKLRVLDKIPNRFDEVIPTSQNGDESKSKEDPEIFESAAEIRVRNRAVYRADLRRELLESSRRGNEHDLTMSQHTENQENLAQDLLTLTRTLKQNMTLAGNVIKDDTKRLSTMNLQVDANRENLAVESARLEKHAYRWCGFDCCILFIFIFLFSSFIFMVMFMKFFHKPVTR
ncbi:unnamed protein product, partial [Mesorhabditis belari]|uniref:Proteasome subunit alpha type-4 n=1 Tax=Mesorhabditis belari TaxID=2138241 RepID=A0AAF3J5D9_9BILA